MGDRGQASSLAHKRRGASRSCEKKTSGALAAAFDELWEQARGAFGQERVFRRARTLALTSLVCLGRRTLTGLISGCGRQFRDWSADYRLFAHAGRFDSNALFGVVRARVLSEVAPSDPLVVAIDDSYLAKSGRKTFGVGWRRDAHTPPFITNFIRAQRVVQISAALPAHSGPAPARMVPIDFAHAPTPVRPRRTAPPEAWAAYERERAAANINLVGAGRLASLRAALDSEKDGCGRDLVACADGRFTNSTFLRRLPERTILVGRVRKDTCLHFVPELGAGRGRGRKRIYGQVAPTPDELRTDESVPWQSVRVHAAGRTHKMRIKTLEPVRWRAVGGRDLRVVVIAPLAYRPRAGAHLRYRDPAYLICTDPALPPADVVQAYVWRWDIEVNFRDEKQLLGVGQAQVRTDPSVERVPQLIVAAYGMLLLAARRVYGSGGLPDLVPPPKWRKGYVPERASTQSLINHLRAELWGTALGVENFSGFTSEGSTKEKPEKSMPDLPSAVLYAAA